MMVLAMAPRSSCCWRSIPSSCSAQPGGAKSHHFRCRVSPAALCQGCRSADPGGGRLVAATPRVVPGAAEGVAVVAKGAPVIRRRPPLSSPDREGVPLELVDVIERVACVGVEATLYLLARIGAEGPFVPDDLDALDPLPVLLEVDALEEEEAAFHPLIVDRSPH